MNKTIPMIAMGVASIFFLDSAFAQIKNDKGTFEKPVKGNVLLETTMSPDLTGGTLFSLNDAFLQDLVEGLPLKDYGFESPGGTTLPMLKVRYFNSDNSSFRIQFNFATGSSKVSKADETTTNTETGFAIAAGYEKHFAGAERLSTYIGGDLLLGYGSQSITALNEISGSGFGFGLRGISGIDYYFIPKVYLGLEIGYGVSYKSYSEVKVAGTGDKNTSSNMTISPFAAPKLRLGYRF